jgi:hypothetical protein
MLFILTIIDIKTNVINPSNIVIELKVFNKPKIQTHHLQYQDIGHKTGRMSSLFILL